VTFRFCTNCPKAGTRETCREGDSEAEHGEQKCKQKRKVYCEEGENRDRQILRFSFCPSLLVGMLCVLENLNLPFQKILWSLPCLDRKMNGCLMAMT